MKSNSFDYLTRSLAHTPTRRGLVAAISTILAGARLSGRVESKNKGKKNKPKKNAFGCLDIGKACNGKDSKCCSGICQGKRPKKGKKDKSECKAHNVGRCQSNEDSCASIIEPCGPREAVCFQTTGKASFCGVTGGGECIACTKDADCEALGFGAGAACIVCEQRCNVFDVATACFRPAA